MGDRRRGGMTWAAAMIGALLGLGFHMRINALRKLPYMHNPWDTVVGMSLGASAFATGARTFENPKPQLDLGKMLEKAKAANERSYIDEDK